MSVLDIVNNSLGKVGGAGDQLDGGAFLPNLDGTDKVTEWVNIKYPTIRKQVIEYFAAMKTPFKETSKFADLGDDLKQDDVAISTVTVGDSPGFTVTVVTQEAHGYTTGDTRFFVDLQGTGVTVLNGQTKNLTVVDDTTFTLDSTTGAATWDHTEDSGIASKVPEMGPWLYAFTLPGDYLAMVRQTDEFPCTQKGVKTEYQYRVILNIEEDGWIILSNTLSNEQGDSAYVEYVIDQEDTTVFTSALIECIAVLLAAELCPIVGQDMKVRQNLLAEYQNLTVKEAKRAIQSLSNNHSKFVPDYSGGRNTYHRGVRPYRQGYRGQCRY